jgi:alkylation response protein AidB-like acyl-CoA dehydrogenase
MELAYTPEEQAFRAEVRRFVEENLPADIRRKVLEHKKMAREDFMRWHRILHERGWVAPHWPPEHGGTGWSVVERHIFEDELAEAGAPPLIPFGVTMVGPVIIQFGNEAQKSFFLPKILSGEHVWCQGFSEPGAGSDLASLRTRAVRDGDHYVVDGQKTWTTSAQFADWIFCLVRTDPKAKKQEGISFLLIDMKCPGVTVRPIITIDGAHEVNEVFFDEVRVPVQNLVGEENKGWDCAKFLLSNERTGAARVGVAKERIRRLKQLARLAADGDRPVIDDPQFREKIAALEVELKAHEMTTMRVLSGEQQRRMKGPDPASSILKLRGTEILQGISELYVELAGPFGLPYRPEADAERWNEPTMAWEWAGIVEPTYFNWRKMSIYGGSNEIQKNILAKAVLGL